MRAYERKITKEQYNRVIAENERGYVEDDLMDIFFTECELCGYGVYGAQVFKQGRTYTLCYDLGDTCD